MFKKSIALLAIAALAACGSDAEEAQIEETTPATETVVEQPVIVEPAPVDQTIIVDSATIEAPVDSPATTPAGN